MQSLEAELPICSHHSQAQTGFANKSGFSGRPLPLLDALQPCRPLLHLIGARMDGLLPTATLRAEPPCQVARASSVVAGLVFVLGIVPLCSYVRVQRLQGVAFASIPPSTKWTSCSAWLHAITGPCRPAVLLPCWAIGAEPENLLVASQTYFIRKVPMLCIMRVVPLCQESSHFRALAICKGRLRDLLLVFLCSMTAFWAASIFADPVVGTCTPLVVAGITEPINRLIAVCNHAVRCSIICFIVPLSYQQGSLGSQGVVLAHFAAAALRTTAAFAPAVDSCLPAVHVPILTLITYPRYFPATHWCHINGTQVSIGSMVPLLLKSWIQTGDSWAFLLFVCMLALTGVTAHFKTLQLRCACVTG